MDTSSGLTFQRGLNIFDGDSRQRRKSPRSARRSRLRTNERLHEFQLARAPMDPLIRFSGDSRLTEDLSWFESWRRRTTAVIGILGLTALVFAHHAGQTYGSASRRRIGYENGDLLRDVDSQLWHQALGDSYRSCGNFRQIESFRIDIPDITRTTKMNETGLVLLLEYSLQCLNGTNCQDQASWAIHWNSYRIGTLATTGQVDHGEISILLPAVVNVNSLTFTLQDTSNSSRPLCLTLHDIAIEKSAPGTHPLNHWQTRELEQSTAAAAAYIHCRITALNVMLDKKQTKENGYFSQEDFVCIPIRSEDGQEGDDYLTVVGRLERHVTVSQLRQARNGTLLAIIQRSSRIAGSISLSEESLGFKVIEDIPPQWTHYQPRTTQTGALGKQSLAIIRVSTRDSTPPMSLEDIRLHFAGARQSAAAQYKLCSFSKFQLQYTSGYDVKLRDSIHDFTSGSQLLEAATTELSRLWKISSVTDLADKVVFCLAPGTPGWVAVAGVNFYRLVVNGDWCLSLSVAMHELGHTVGLIHSGAGDVVYGDESGYMGYGDKAIKWPRKCFNALNHWQLGWYADRHRRIVNAKSLTGPNFVTLAAFVDYQKTGEFKKVILNIEDKYYLQYNRAKAFNQDTEEDPDKVVVIQDTVGYSSLLKGMDVGDAISLGVSGTRGKLVIKVCHRVDGTVDEPDFMVLSVSMNRAYCQEWPGRH